MKNIRIALLMVFGFAATPFMAQNASDIPQPDTIKKSIPRETIARIGGADIRIKYHAPAVRGRMIWGGLVALDQVWVTGAHSATSIEVSNAFDIGGKTLAAGKYALFTIPNKESWTVIINKNWQQHLADDYKESEDLVRLTVKPQANEPTERLTYSLEKLSDTEGSISMAWEKLKLNFSIKINQTVGTVALAPIKLGLQTDTLRVNGDCGMCKKSIETACYTLNGLKNATWDDEALILVVTYDPSKTNADAILKKVASIGYDNEKYKSTEKAYKSLPECCQYDRTRL